MTIDLTKTESFDPDQSLKTTNQKSGLVTDTQKDKQTDTLTDKQTDRLTDKQTDRLTDKQTDRLINWKKVKVAPLYSLPQLCVCAFYEPPPHVSKITLFHL